LEVEELFEYALNAVLAEPQKACHEFLVAKRYIKLSGSKFEEQNETKIRVHKLINPSLKTSKNSRTISTPWRHLSA
jgi:hypothetical protein